MSTDENRNDQLEDDLQGTAEESVSGVEEQPEAASGPENEADALRDQVQDLNDQMLRLQAEMQNVRRRAEMDVEKARKFGLERMVKELLPVADSLEKAVESTAGDAEGDALVVSMREGIEMTLALYLGSLKKFGVEQLNPLGEPFDPQLHEAMSMVPAPEAEPNSVVAVVQKGYTLNDRLVRPAMVVVAKAEDAPKIDEQA
ncbi:nucleotide exchange factor GrpE [Marinobacter sp. X15-166B]|uniref:nucleotide exchange factor GrpE n=1 Tax=Marinobacter sp. X15-166B TaxID=1897620 RepID=UPI00085BFF90|nr:nucleotide exchange factor GrpE [Marinobacter sp. X15-166B]OEY65623.1 nucleotide exchange factor GrpE [Marinobacter sp. X15-166B]